MPPIERDKIFVWARPHRNNAIAPDTVPRPRDWELVSSQSQIARRRSIKHKGFYRRMTNSGWSSSHALLASCSLPPVMSVHTVSPVPLVYRSYRVR
jgi:hypothetical protein